jgi:hypothetical protein
VGGKWHTAILQRSAATYVGRGGTGFQALTLLSNVLTVPLLKRDRLRSNYSDERGERERERERESEREREIW